MILTETQRLSFRRGVFRARAMEPSREGAEPRPYDNLRFADEILNFVPNEKSRIAKSMTLWQAGT